MINSTFTSLLKEIKKEENELDAVTGASGTSEAVELFLNRELKVVTDDIRNNRFE